MPVYPDLNVLDTETLFTSTFLGLNKGLSIADGEMADMQNLTGDNFPVLTTRSKRTLVEWREKVSTISKPYGLVGGDRLVVIDSDSLYVDGVKVEGLALSTDPSMQPKHIVLMGAYACVWPDKVYVNTTDTTDFGPMGVSYAAEGTVSAVMCRADGTDYDETEILQAAEAPENPTDNQLWMDTSGDKDVLKQYSAAQAQWVQVATTYVKLQASGLGSGIRTDDTVFVSGASPLQPKDNTSETTTTTTGTESFDVDSVSLTSSWWVSKDPDTGDPVHSTPTYASSSRTVTVSGLPDGAVVTNAYLVYTASTPYTGAGTRSINGTNIPAYGAGQMPITVTGNGDVSIKFAFRAYGSTGTSRTSSTLTFSGMSLVVEWSKTTTEEGEANLTDKDKAAVAALNTSCVVYGAGDDYIIVAGLLPRALTLGAGMRVERRIPDLQYVTESNNRIWGCRYAESDGKLSNEILACALGDFRNWYSYRGTAADSYALSVGSGGEFTGATTLKGYPIFFKETVMHRIAGSTPATFQLVSTDCRGVQDGCWRSILQVGENLYYKGRTDVMVYDGSVPQSISSALGRERYFDAAAGRLGSKYYLSMRTASGKWSLFVYDTDKGLWHREDAAEIHYFANVSGDLLFVKDGTLYSAAGQTTKAEGDYDWSATFGVYGYAYEGHKYLSRFNIRAWMPAGAVMRLEIQYDSDGVWHDEGEMRSARTQSFMLPVLPRRCDHCQLRLSGTGEVKVFSIARVLEYGGDA